MATQFAQGIDVSRWQTNVDWASVQAAGMAFAFCKATQGVQVVDKFFAQNWAGIKKAGLARGAYHFYDPMLDPAQQAQLFLRTVKLEPGDLPPVLDVEQAGTASNDALIRGTKTWLDAVEQATGRKSIIYTRASFWNERLRSSSGQYPEWAKDYKLWTAHYTSAPNPLVPRGWTAWTFWQFTESGTVNGVAGKVDMNRYNGTADDLRAWLQSETGSAPAPQPAEHAAPAAQPGPKEIVEAYFQALNNRDLDALAALYQPGAAHITAARTVSGVQDIRAWYEDLLNNQLPNGQFVLKEIKSETPLIFNWTCDSAAAHVLDGSDTVGLLEGKIQYHSSIFTLAAS